MRKVHIKEMTELHFAAPAGHQKVISALLTHSINADSRTDDGMTTIYCIVEKGSIFTTSTATGFEFIIVGWIVVLELFVMVIVLHYYHQQTVIQQVHVQFV